jgi:hypothetical protein
VETVDEFEAERDQQRGAEHQVREQRSLAHRRQIVDQVRGDIDRTDREHQQEDDVAELFGALDGTRIVRGRRSRLIHDGIS